MHSELPVFQRCCFCLPLRYGLLTWGYIRLASSLLCIIGLIITFFEILAKDASQWNDSMDIVYMAILGFLILLTMTDLVLNTIFIVGGHMKNPKLLRAYYIYSFIFFILTVMLNIASAISTVLMFKVGEINLTVHIWIILVDFATLLAQVLIQIYVLLLVRSEIIKLRSHCEFTFVNNAAEAECTLKCEEMSGEEYKYERYVPELYK